ncbi:MAG TPA: ABC transporter permease [Ilumatobacteraceae bacterium]|nr:ABC transporter permease [Ilumatobacteraceae bacterium]
MTGTTRLVAEREVRESFRRRTIWITAVVLVLLSTALVVVPDLIGGDSDERTVAAVGTDAEIDRLGATLDQFAPSFGLEIVMDPTVDAATARTAVENDDADVAVVLGDAPVRLITQSADSDIVTLTQQAITVTALRDALDEAGVSSQEVLDIFAGTATVVDELDPVDTGRQATAAVVSILLYLILVLLTTAVASGVAIEKSNRVSEVLLAIVPPRNLLFGKILGVSIVGLFVLLCGVLPVAVKFVLGGSLPDGVAPTLAGSAVWFVLGIAIYLTAAGALGSLVDRQEEVGSTVAPLSAVLIAAYLVGVSAPESPLATVLAYVPFTSPMVMPARIALGAASPWELGVSFLLGVATVFLTALVAERVYARAIVRTGRKVKLRELVGTESRTRAGDQDSGVCSNRRS